MRKTSNRPYSGSQLFSMCVAAALLAPMASTASALGASAAPSPAAVSTGGPFIACSTSGGAGIDTYVTGVFQSKYPVKYLPSGGYLVDQSVLDRFYAYLTHKGHHFKPGSNYGCVVESTEARAKVAEHKRYESGGCSNCGKVVETGWKDTP
jgi:hypothetical protein